MKIPEANHSISSLIDKHHEKIADAPRPHMGCSQLGHPCDRWLWLSFRWAVQPKFDGRLLRLFRRGQLEEATIVSDLRAIGMGVQMTGERQSRVKLGAHVSGSVDAVIESGVPEAPKKRHVAEFKTHNKKSFDLLERDGVQKAKPEHYIQMQLYMHGLDIDRALYVAVCKDDDRIHTERVRYDKETASKYLARGQRIALSDRMPEPMSTDPTWYQCRWCPAHKFCHETKITEHVNCRTCAHSTAMPDSTWRCERHEADGIPVEFQRQGCDSHVLHPDMVPWPLGDSDSDHVATYLIDSKSVKNGEPNEGVFTSRELLANATACASSDAGINGMRSDFDGRIVG